MVLAKPQPFNVTRGAASKAFVGQIGLHAVTYRERFPTDAIKVGFAVSFMKDDTATWSQTYLEKVFNGEPVLNEFLNNFRSSFFDHNRRHHAKVALQNLCQTGTVSAYMQEFNQHTCTVGQKIEGIQQDHPAPNPNAMDLSAFQKAPSNQLSNTKQTCWVQQTSVSVAARRATYPVDV
ncbi:uncharacterized protein VP01_3513g1 [Puccinia sorghi]|uniref:Retrotransposon gag domain-containing protein n=1 Tax=Puccinia sorghi TaxID=27349 RepID=A0A0L6UVK1_9BASI|nr:uncharacterized protein VP01_3513g1 [Puccinia sorghi]